MLISRDRLIGALCQVWPALRPGTPRRPVDLYVPRTEYWCPKMEHVQEFLGQSHLDQVHYSLRTFSCANFAIVLHGEAKVWLHRLVEAGRVEAQDIREWVFGHCWGTRFHGQELGHAVNLCLTSDQGLVLIDPQDDSVWTPTPGDDVIHFAEI